VGRDSDSNVGAADSTSITSASSWSLSLKKKFLLS